MAVLGLSEGSVICLKVHSVLEAKGKNTDGILTLTRLEVFKQPCFIVLLCFFVERPLNCHTDTCCYGTNLQTIPQALHL